MLRIFKILYALLDRPDARVAGCQAQGTSLQPHGTVPTHGCLDRAAAISEYRTHKTGSSRIGRPSQEAT